MSNTTVKPYNNSDSTKKEEVAQMFNNIAHRYDFLNHLLSMGIDRIWRRKGINLLKAIQPKQILDVATGTGDFALEALRLNPDKVIGLDISKEMLAHGEEKIRKKGLSNKISMQLGDSENMPFEDNTFDAITVAFGVRNFENLEKGLKEMNRVMKTGGKVVILEFSKPTQFPIKQGFNFYFKHILPRIGKLVSSDNRAYTYLPESVKVFPEGKTFLNILEKSGFKTTTCEAQTFGICSIYTGIK